MSRPKRILVIDTGGTIGGEPYDPANTPDDITPLEPNIIPDTLRYGIASEEAKNCEFYQWHRKDSKKFSSWDITNLGDIIRTAPYDYVILLHGTDRTPENSRQLETALEGSGKTLVVTGAMTPLANREQSDGYANLECAISRIKSLEPGTYVVAHAKIFKPQGLWKDFASKEFKTTNPEGIVP